MYVYPGLGLYWVNVWFRCTFIQVRSHFACYVNEIRSNHDFVIPNLHFMLFSVDLQLLLRKVRGFMRSTSTWRNRIFVIFVEKVL